MIEQVLPFGLVDDAFRQTGQILNRDMVLGWRRM
jgi:hypothetical protein